MTALLDKLLIKKSLKYWIEKDPNFVENLLLEINTDLKLVENEHFEKLVADNFKKYEQTFKALQ